MKYEEFYKHSLKEREDIIQEINFSETRLVFALLGSCQRLVKWLMDKEGISKNLIGIYMPYSKEAIDDFLDFNPSNYVNSKITVKLAEKNYVKFYKNNNLRNKMISIAVSSSLQTNRIKRSSDIGYITIYNRKKFLTYKIEFVPGKLTRIKQDFIISFYVLKIIYLYLFKNTDKLKTFNIEYVKISTIEV